MEYFCANILKSGHWPRTRCRLKIFKMAAVVGHLVSLLAHLAILCLVDH